MAFEIRNAEALRRAEARSLELPEDAEQRGRNPFAPPLPEED